MTSRISKVGTARQAWPGLIYLRARPTWVRFSDFRAAPPVILEWSGVELAGEDVTGSGGGWKARREIKHASE